LFHFYILDAVSTRFKKEENPLNERQFKQAIQAVLNNVKDWNKKRTKRRQHATHNIEDIQNNSE